jgi:hypothetical protein
MTIEVTTNSFFLNFLSSSSLDKVKQSKAVAQNTLKLPEFGVFYFVLILLGVGNPHRHPQFGIVAIKISNFLPEFGSGKYTNFLKI